MPLNKLDNFIKNTEGRILYVNPSDLDATDSLDNQGNSLARPFKTIQRAIIEAARFSYVRGNNNDLIEKTTILLFPGEHVVDNRPGWAIYDNIGVAYAVPPSGGVGTPAQSALSLGLNSNFDLNQEDNLLYKYNSVYGGVILPRGISLVGLDLRKTKVRPLYVPNPTDPNTGYSSIFRLTGTCYIWQTSFFDGDELGEVYTDPIDFGSTRKSVPLFSHHKLTCFEYADGVNDVASYGLTDLDMYYSKLSNAWNDIRSIPSVDKYPENSDGFSKRTPEWEIVGAFASDPIDITSVKSGNGTVASTRVEVTTATPHDLNVGTPIKIKGVSVSNYNISTKVQEIVNQFTFTYLLPSFPINLDADPSVAGSTVIVETDTVTGASPYVFNCSLRSVWGMNGMFADGSKASGFKSMVVAQFTGVSLQKDDRAFVKYSPVSRTYNGVLVSPVYGAELPLGAAQTDPSRSYHLDPDAIYRTDWETSHIKIANDAFIQVVSVFAIGFTYHFNANSGGDFSITNSNSNFGQNALNSTGFRKRAFDKDNNGYITSIVPPKAIDLTEEDIAWVSIDVGLTTSIGDSSHLYLNGFTNANDPPSNIIQGYRIGSRVDDILYLGVNGGDTVGLATIFMEDTNISSKKEYNVSGSPSNNIFNLGEVHQLETGERVLIFSNSGDLPEGLSAETVYYVIDSSSTEIKLASTQRNSDIGEEISVYGGSSLKIVSRVSEKSAGDIGSPLQYDTSNNNWYINVDSGNSIYPLLDVSQIGPISGLAYLKRFSDQRSIDEKIYKIRVVIPKESRNAKDPESGFVIQESSSVELRSDSDFFATSIESADHSFNRNPRYISTCTFDNPSQTISIIVERPHELNVGDIVVINGVRSTTNLSGIDNIGYNGVFEVTSIPNDLTFTYGAVDVDNINHVVGNCTNDTNLRTLDTLGTFQRRNNNSSIYIYRNEVSSRYEENIKDGIFYLYPLNASNFIQTEFTDLAFSQSPVDLYPQLDRDNVDDNPLSAITYARRSPVGDVETNSLQKSITRETIDKLLKSFNYGLKIIGIGNETTTTPSLIFDRPHGFGRVIGGTLTAGSGYIDGTYYNIKLLETDSDPSSGWKGALATITVSSGSVISVNVTNGGSFHSPGNLYFDYTTLGLVSSNDTGFLTLTSNTINNNIGDVIQFTGSTNNGDLYHRINSIISSTEISVTRNLNDGVISSDQYAVLVGPSIEISSSSGTIERTINTITSHGLVSGNKITIIDSSNLKRGDYLVDSVVDVDTFIVKDPNITLGSITNGYVLKNGLSANAGELDLTEENFSTRNLTFYSRENFNLDIQLFLTDTQVNLTTNSGTLTSSRLSVGDYLLISNEVLRILEIVSPTSVRVIRGYLGTRSSSHPANSLIKKIRPIPVEFRRPSILRASGHTFEYLGYGPGNYSTALPQIQVKTLSDLESFLSQAQERSAGIVVYNGINNNGDVFAGNTKTLASSGEIISYDIPVPTVTGQDASTNSQVFDEVTIKQKILVEGGSSGTILSQFDGPVTFNSDLRIKGSTNITGNLNVEQSSGDSIILNGDVQIGGNLDLVGDLDMLSGNINVNGIVTATGGFEGNLVGDVSGNAGSADSVLVARNQTDAVFYPSFVDSNNTSGSIESLYTDAGIQYNPSTNQLTVGNTVKVVTGSNGSAGLTISDGYGNCNVTFNHVAGIPDIDGNSGRILVNTNTSSDAYMRFELANSVSSGVAVDPTTLLELERTVGGDNNITFVGNTVWHAGNDGPGSNLDADTVDTFQTATSATANTVAVRDSSADITARDFRTSEASSATVVDSASVIMRVDTGVDNDLRPITAAGFGSWLDNVTTTTFVRTTGNQSIAGTKTFTGSVTVNGSLSGSTLSLSSTLSASGKITANAGIRLNDSDILEFGNSADMEILHNGSNGYIDINTGNLFVRDGSTTRFTLDDNGTFSATGDIIAFASDMRLKTNIEKIDSALDKVCSLSGFTYNFNELAHGFGYSLEKRHLGVSAQEVKEVAPEAIETALISEQSDTDYMTVKYEKLIPLLIEAIKEQNEKIGELEEKLNQLGG